MHAETLNAGLRERWRDYLELTKPKVVLLIVFTAQVGMLLAVPGAPDWLRFWMASLGIGLASAASAAVNHFVDQKIDAVMARTQHRPVARGKLGAVQVLGFAALLCVAGMAILAIFTNALTAWLTFFSMIGYAVIYTLFLKRATPQNIVIGGAAGAAPPLLGWVAMTGQLHPWAFLLFLIIFVWTPPHFWALAVYRRDDYAKAGIPMLPVTHGVECTCWQIVLYTILLTLVTLLPFLTGMSGFFYLFGTLVLNVGFLGYAIRLARTRDEWVARSMFAFSITYLMVLFALLLIDHYLPAVRWVSIAMQA